MRNETALLRNRVMKVLTYVLVITVCVVAIFPVLWALSSELKLPLQQYQWPPQLIPWPIYFGNFSRLFEIMKMDRYLVNSTIIAVTSMVGMCISSSMGAYAFARLRFRGRDFLFGVLLATMMIPYAITLIPTFLVFSKLKLVDTFVPLIAPNWFGSAFMVFLLRQAYIAIPQELVDAAKLDGASHYAIFLRIFVPLTMPTLVTVGLLQFLFSWNDLLGPLIYLNNPDLYTVQRGLSLLLGRAGTGIDRRGVSMAGALLGMVPMLALYVFGQRYFIGGLTRSGIKG
jgi:ABC-type glycerol-3-phosphate transport system permease component